MESLEENCLNWESMSESEKEKNKRQHDVYMQQRKHHLESESYAVARIDIILVTISSAGILMNSKLIDNDSQCNQYFYISLFGFILTIILNLIGQYASMEAHAKDEQHTLHNIHKNSGLSNLKDTPEPILESKIINWSNYLGLIFFCLSLIILGIGVCA